MNRGRSLELFFVDGTPDGILTAEMFNWTGHVLSTPRTRIADALARTEARHTGVYLLLGQQDGVETVYVGEGEDVSRRIREHDTKKDWWERCVIITTGRQELHKAHVRYMEARLITMVADAGAATLDNGTRPVAQGLTEAAVASMEQFLDMLGVALPAIGVSVLETGRTVQAAPKVVEDVPVPVFHFKTARSGIDAFAELREAQFVVLTGSKLRDEWVGAEGHVVGYKALHQRLCDSGVIDTSHKPAILTADYAFKSPSAAAAVVSGRAANGRTEWKLPDGTTFADWEEAQVSARIGEAI